MTIQDQMILAFIGRFLKLMSEMMDDSTVVPNSLALVGIMEVISKMNELRIVEISGDTLNVALAKEFLKSRSENNLV